MRAAFAMELAGIEQRIDRELRRAAAALTMIADRLERAGHPVSATARAHIAAVRYAHVNQHGRYRFTKRGPADGRLRRLRPANISRYHGGTSP